VKITFEGGPRAGQDVSIDPGRSVTIGRDPAADVFIDDPRASRPHARITVDAGGSATIEDLGSTNGTFVNGVRIQGPTPLRDADAIALGNTRLVVGGIRPGDATIVVGNATVVDVSPPATAVRPASPSMIVMRESVSKANRNSRIAAIVAGGVVLVAIIAVAWFFLFGRAASNDEIVTRMKPSVVYVDVQNDYVSGNGTGWVLDADKGLIVTNNHVIDGIERVTVSGEGLTPRSANIVAAAPCDDIAVIHVDDKAGLASVKQGSQANLRQGDDVLALGYPVTGSSQRNLVLTAGTVSVVKTTFEGEGEINNLPNVIQTTARINPGNSGGPLVNRAGEVVGMNTILIPDLDQNYAIGIDRIKELAGELSTGQGRAWTGMGLTVPDEKTLTGLGLPVTPGLLVVSVIPGTEADQAGFGQFPVLVTAVDGRAVSDMPTYCAAVGSRKSGDQATFTVTYLDPADGSAVTGDVPMTFR
jgi:S1-C subfamily serine protease